MQWQSIQMTWLNSVCVCVWEWVTQISHNQRVTLCHWTIKYEEIGNDGIRMNRVIWKNIVSLFFTLEWLSRGGGEGGGWLCTEWQVMTQKLEVNDCELAMFAGVWAQIKNEQRHALKDKFHGWNIYINMFGKKMSLMLFCFAFFACVSVFQMQRCHSFITLVFSLQI